MESAASARLSPEGSANGTRRATRSPSGPHCCAGPEPPCCCSHSSGSSLPICCEKSQPGFASAVPTNPARRGGPAELFQKSTRPRSPAGAVPCSAQIVGTSLARSNYLPLPAAINTPLESEMRMRRLSSSNCSRWTCTTGQSVRSVNFSDHSTTTTAGSARTSSRPIVSRS